MKRHGPERLLAGLFLMLLVGAPLASAELSAQRRHELDNLLLQDCGSCHGMTLKGGLGPALTPQALRGKPDELLFNTILHGREGTPMPPWGKLLTPEEVRWLVQRLRRGGER